MKERKGGLLEVFVVSARGIRHSNIIGKPSYYVIVECGSQSYRTKISSGNPKEILWNEKFKFELASSKLELWYYLKLKIMEEEFFTGGGFVGETTVYLKGIITEGNEKGFMEVTPVAHNVVLEDDTYKGQIKVGLRFTPTNVCIFNHPLTGFIDCAVRIFQNDCRKTVQTVERGNASKENGNNGVGEFIYSKLIDLWQNTWWRSFVPYGDADSSVDKNKPN